MVTPDSTMKPTAAETEKGTCGQHWRGRYQCTKNPTRPLGGGPVTWAAGSYALYWVGRTGALMADMFW